LSFIQGKLSQMHIRLQLTQYLQYSDDTTYLKDWRLK
jgi:hypothetical protein